MCSSTAPIGLTTPAFERSRRNNDRTIAITNINLFVTRIFGSQQASVSSGHKNARLHKSQHDTRTSHRPTGRYWRESQSGDDRRPFDRTATSVEVREVFESFDGINEVTKGRANFETCSCDEIMCRRARTKILEYANNSEVEESSWTRYIKTIEKSPSENKSSFVRISRWVDREFEVQRAASLSKERVESPRSDLAWLRANHPFLKK